MIKKLITILVGTGIIWGLASCAGNTLKSWSIHDGDQVTVKADAIACRVVDPSGEWHDCNRVAGGPARIVPHPDFGRELAGRVRVDSPTWGIGWLELADVNP